MVEWYHGLNGPEFEQTSGDSEEQGSLACCSPWGLKEWTRLNNNVLLRTHDLPLFILALMHEGVL